MRRARLIIATELGKDPLMRIQMRKLFKEEARVTVEPTERGIVKIDESHPYYVCPFLNLLLQTALVLTGDFRTSNTSYKNQSSQC